MHLSHEGSHHGPPAAGRPLSPAGSADVICQTKTYINTGSTDEIRGPKAGLSDAIRGEEPSQLSFSFSPLCPTALLLCQTAADLCNDIRGRLRPGDSGPKAPES